MRSQSLYWVHTSFGQSSHCAVIPLGGHSIRRPLHCGITFLVTYPVNTHVKYFYLPHPKDDEGNVFTGVCLFTEQVPQSQVLSLVSGPRSFQERYPSPRFFPRSLVLGPFPEGYTSPSLFPRSLVSGPFLGGGYTSPETEQQSKFLLCGEWYASCSHAGGLSCYF